MPRKARSGTVEWDGEGDERVERVKDDVGLHHAIVVQLAKVAHTTHTLLVVPRLIHLTDIRQTHIHTHRLMALFLGTTLVSQHQKGKTSLDFTEASDSE